MAPSRTPRARLDLRDFDLPFFAEAATNLHAPSLDPKVLAWQDAIRPYDGYIFIVAEYTTPSSQP